MRGKGVIPEGTATGRERREDAFRGLTFFVKIRAERLEVERERE